MPQAPVAKKRKTTLTLHQISRTDNYAWLRDNRWQQVINHPDSLNPEIREYLVAENRYTETLMQTQQKQTRQLFAELKSKVRQDDQSVPDQDGAFAYYTRYVQAQQHPVFCRCPTQESNKEEILLDCNQLASALPYWKNGYCRHSPNHRFFAYSFDTTGGENFQLKIRDLSTQQDLKETLEHIQGEFVWTETNDAIVYTRLDKNHRPEQVMLHRLGTDPKDDTSLYREKDPEFFMSVYKTRSSKLIGINIHNHTTSEVRLLPANKPSTQNILVRAREEGVEYRVEERNDTLILLTNIDGHQDFKLCTTPFSAVMRMDSHPAWDTLYTPEPHHLITDFVVGKEFIACLQTNNALPQMVIIQEPAVPGKTPEQQNIRDKHTLAFKEEAYALAFENTSNYGSPLLRFRYSSMRTPWRTYDYNIRQQQSTLMKEHTLPVPYHPKDYCTKRLWATAHDGEKIPISILYHKETPIDASAPLLLYGYGAYGLTVPAQFSSNRLSLVDRGFVYAIAHIRGGREKGEAWYQAGKLNQKKNTFDDFLAVAEHLIQKQYTSRGNISIHGGSAGGLLIAAVLNQAPQTFRAAVAEVPFVDVLNTICDHDLPLTPPEWNEWGNPIKDLTAYKTIASYSPYENIKRQAYPATLVTAGISDPRVTYWEPAKWVAKLREYKTDSNPLLLKTNLSCGHAGAAGRFDYLKELAFIYSFILHRYPQSTTEVK